MKLQVPGRKNQLGGPVLARCEGAAGERRERVASSNGAEAEVAGLWGHLVPWEGGADVSYGVRFGNWRSECL